MPDKIIHLVSVFQTTFCNNAVNLQSFASFSKKARFNSMRDLTHNFGRNRLAQTLPDINLLRFINLALFLVVEGIKIIQTVGNPPKVVVFFQHDNPGINHMA